MSNDSVWSDAKLIRSFLVRDGWRSPDTYCNFYARVTDIPAVYLFLLYMDAYGSGYDKAMVAYVGMSTALRTRIYSHNVLPQLNRPGYWPMRWFKPTFVGNLRSTERHYIERFNPPWNISGRKRGVELAHG